MSRGQLVEFAYWLGVALLLARLLGAPQRRREAERRFRWWNYRTMRAAHPEWHLEGNPYVWRYLVGA